MLLVFLPNMDDNSDNSDAPEYENDSDESEDVNAFTQLALKYPLRRGE